MIKDIFKVELYKVKLRGVDNESIVDYIKERADITYDNEIGRSKDDVDVLNNSLFKNLNNQVTEHVNKLFHMTSHEKYHLRLNQGWYNKESDDLILTPHKHQHSVYSAVYYPVSIDGQIRFQNPAHHINYMLESKHIKNWNEYIGDYHNEEVRTGDLIIFKSGLFHWVVPSKYDRCSVAYNTEVVSE